MAFAFVQQGDSGAANEAARSTVSVVLGSTPVQNNLLVTCAVSSSAGTGLVPSGAGWTVVQDITFPGGLTARWAMYYKIAGVAESTTVTWTTTGVEKLAMWVAEYSGVDTAAAVDVSEGRDTGPAEAYSGITTDPAYKGGLALGFIAYEDGTSSTTYSINDTQFQGHPSTMAKRGSDFSHRNGTDATKVLGQVWESIGSAIEQNPCCVGTGLGGSADNGGGIAVIFKASGASAADAHISGAGSAAFVQEDTFSSTAAGTGITIDWPAATTTGNLLVVFLVYSSATATASATGWTQLGGYLLFTDQGSPGLGSPNRTLACFTKTADGTEDPTTFTLSVDSLSRVGWGGEYSTATLSGINTVASHNHPSALANSTVGGITVGTLKYELGTVADRVCVAAFAGGNTAVVVSSTDNGWVGRGGAGVSGASIRVLDVLGNANKHVSCRFTTTDPGGTTVFNPSASLILSFVAGAGDHWAWAEDTHDSWQLVA